MEEASTDTLKERGILYSDHHFVVIALDTKAGFKKLKLIEDEVGFW